MLEGVIDRLRAAARGEAGITFVGVGQRPVRLGYTELMDRVEVAAGSLDRHGLAPGDRAIVVGATGPELVTAFLACMRVGAAPTLCSPPHGFSGRDAFRRHLERLADILGTRRLIVEAALMASVDVSWDAYRVLRLEELSAGAPSRTPLPGGRDQIAFIQATSGTTGAPRAAAISHGALAANLTAIAQCAEIGPSSTVVSWLPLWHDMGLVGGLLTPIHAGCDLVLSRPSSFLRRPRLWLEWITSYAGTHSPAPSFAYRYVLDRVRADALEGLDLASWRVAWIGAEPVYGALLERFAEQFAPVGFQARTFLPCYGLAEATLAVTFYAHQDEPRVLSVRRDTLERGSAIAVGGSPAVPLVSCGEPLPNLRVSITDEELQELGEGRVGEICVRGESVFSGYFSAETEFFDAPPLPVLRTGDLGFLLDGELYITGRLKDLMIVRGHNYHPSEVEAAAIRGGRVRGGRAAAFSIHSEALGTEEPVLLVEAAAHDDLQAVAAEIRRSVQEETSLAVAEIVFLPPGTLPYTTSGKLKRGELRAVYDASRAAAGTAP